MMREQLFHVKNVSKKTPKLSRVKWTHGHLVPIIDLIRFQHST